VTRHGALGAPTEMDEKARRAGAIRSWAARGSFLVKPLIRRGL